MSKENTNETVNAEVTANEETKETKVKEKFGVKVKKTFTKVKNSKATKVIVTTVGAIAIGAAGYYAGKKGIPDFGSSDNLDDTCSETPCLTDVSADVTADEN